MREDIFVHEPFLKELENIGWNDKSNGCEVIRLDRLHQKPEQSYRESFSDVVMKSKLRESLLKINNFLEEDQIEECVTRRSIIQLIWIINPMDVLKSILICKRFCKVKSERLTVSIIFFASKMLR